MSDTGIGFILFMKEKYVLRQGSATWFRGRRSHLHLEAEGDGLEFGFFRFESPGGEELSDFEGHAMTDQDMSDTYDSTNFTLYDERYPFVDAYAITCLDAKLDRELVVFEWEFFVELEEGRKPKKMRGGARFPLRIVE